MTAKEYFGDWMRVIDKKELSKVMKWLQVQNIDTLCPIPKNVFKAFRVCDYNKLRVVFIGEEPYPQKGVATGILFGNSSEVLSPSLEIIKEAVINYEIPHNLIEFDNTLESWAQQGILMLNSTLTCEINKIGCHIDIWQPFISKLIQNICQYNTGILFVLFGNQASTFKKYISPFQTIMEVPHPAYFARKNIKMPYKVFTDINRFLENQYGEPIKFYHECFM